MWNPDDPLLKKVYELRTYSIYPNKRKDFLDLVSAQYHIRTKGSNLFAYWVSDIGGINEVVHMWSYDDLNQRAEERGNLAQREEWTDLLSKLSPMLHKQENMLLDLHPDSPVPNASKEAAVFELQMYQMNSNSTAWPNYLSRLIKKTKILPSNSSSSLVGVWQSAIGPQNLCVMIWQHETPNDVIQLKTKLAADNTYVNFRAHTSSHYTKIMNPFITHLWSEKAE